MNRSTKRNQREYSTQMNLTETCAENSTIRGILSVLYDEYEPRIRAMLPPTDAKLRKIAHSHGDTFPQTMAASENMDELSDELALHLARGKEVLRPRVNELLTLRSRGTGELAHASWSQLGHLTHEFTVENRVIRRYLSEIRELTSRYTAPDGMSMTFSVGYRELAAFDRLLSQYLAIEEEALIPRLHSEPSTW